MWSWRIYHRIGYAMIDEARTLRLFGHTFVEARYGDRIVVVCGKCRERRVKLKGEYLRHQKRTGRTSDLCRSCSKKGHTASPEAKEKMRNAKLGKPRNLSEDARQRIADAARKCHTGRVASAETRAKMAESQKKVPLSSRPRGDKHCCWCGGVSQWRNTLTSSVTYKNWRTAVFKRDDYTCQMCNERGGRLEAHHIRPVRDHKNDLLIFDINNGITLCRECHREVNRHEEEFESFFDNKIKEVK